VRSISKYTSQVWSHWLQWIITPAHTAAGVNLFFVADSELGAPLPHSFANVTHVPAAAKFQPLFPSCAGTLWQHVPAGAPFSSSNLVSLLQPVVLGAIDTRRQSDNKLVRRRMYEVALPVPLQNSRDCRVDLWETLAAGHSAREVDGVGRPRPEQQQPSGSLYSSCQRQEAAGTAAAGADRLAARLSPKLAGAKPGGTKPAGTKPAGIKPAGARGSSKASSGGGAKAADAATAAGKAKAGVVKAISSSSGSNAASRQTSAAAGASAAAPAAGGGRGGGQQTGSGSSAAKAPAAENRRTKRTKHARHTQGSK
jgi:hypothetical protein